MTPTARKRRSIPWWVLTLGIAFLLCVGLILSEFDSLNNRANSYQGQLGRVEVAYVRLHEQVVAAHLNPAAPTLPVLLRTTT